MKSKILIHLTSMIFITSIALLLIVFVNASKKTKTDTDNAFELKGLPDLSFVDFSSRFQKALALDAMNVFFPGQFDKNNLVITSLADKQDRAFRNKIQDSGNKEGLSLARLENISGMFFKFIAVYAIVMLLTYYGVQTIGAWRFCRKKNGSVSAKSSGCLFVNVIKKTILFSGSFLLFCPAYVIAYSLRTEINTDTVFFMIILCVISNGLLMVYSNKFYAFLIAESRKGYIDTAIVKNLNNSYTGNIAQGISFKAILNPVKQFKGHVFDNIFRNARFQYLSTIKEQASFLITGMIITEMALNLHGYYSYEMLRQMLYGNSNILIVMFLGIFYTVKATEIFTDILVYKENLKYENK
ncbi:MAG TPA: hypothetical protein DCO75_00920 [Fibrobacteres bacterium]|jgi:hypothetical protein|nr:hypothetical protein [Fibrobacterota bacterium]